MKILALSGSLRHGSTNTALLRALAAIAAPPVAVNLLERLGALPLCNPDQEGPLTPLAVLGFAAVVAAADGIVIACPEYVHAKPGAFKNAIDWLVSRQEIIGKPIALLHASHGGEDVLADLRRVLATVSDGFSPGIFALFALRKLSPEDVAAQMSRPKVARALDRFLQQFQGHIGLAQDCAAAPV